MAKDPTFLDLALQKSVMRRAAKISAIVGTILIIINHSDTIMMNSGSWITALKCALTYAVPYCVSTYSAVMAMREKALQPAV